MKIIDGNKACSNVAYLFSEICAIYPITPSSPMAENIDMLRHTDKTNLFNCKPEITEMESEMGAAGALHGALLSGSLATTFTASQGLLLMIPNMYKIAGEMLPGVIHVASRSLATHALSIFGDHQDIYATRQTGFCILASTNAIDAEYLAAVAHLSAIKGSLPFIHFFDGFRTSHEINTVPEIDATKLISLVDKNALEKFKNRSLNINHDFQYGSSETEDIYFQCMEAKNKYYDEIPDIVNEYMQKINEISGKNYKPFEYYGDDDATDIIVAMGSVCDTIKLVIDKENKNGKKLGLIEVHLYRPFSEKYLKNVLPNTTQRIAVLDRTKESGSIGEPLYLDVLSALKDSNIEIVGGRYGLSSKNTTPAQIMAVYDMLSSKMQNNFTIGIEDNLTYLSLPTPDYYIDLNTEDIKIYGFGSDGMVSTSKDILNIVHNSLNKYVQGYFEYDSKKSGGVTISHIRIGDKPILAPYYVQNPELIVITKDEYLKKYDMFNDLKNDTIILINTIKNENELNEFIPYESKKKLLSKNIKVKIINATKIAYENHIAGKISKIMEVAILSILNIDNVIDIVEKSIIDKFTKKGEDVVNNNINAIKDSLNSIKDIKITFTDVKEEKEKYDDIYSKIDKRKGGNLTVKDVLPVCDGKLPLGLSKREKRNVSNLTPKWIPDKCIMCGMCSFVCPHAVIRNFLIEDKDKGKKIPNNEEYNFYVGISNKDCTGCSLCANVCPTHSLEMKENVTPTDEYFEDYENPKIYDKFSIKGASLEKPKFEFSGACAGCGETPYIRLLSQLYGNEIVIANATGCSSIYGNSCPSTPYLMPWANSLFEDNAEFAYGIHMSYLNKRKQIKDIMKSSYDVVEKDIQKIYDDYLNNENDSKITNDIANNIDKYNLPKEIKDLKDYIPSRTVWAIGGDGWAYDIGYNGIDHILHSNENIKILVLDTEVYSNTGGQASKSTNIGAVAEFADLGKRTNKKDLFKIASSIDNVYVASICLGANMMQTIKAFKEAMEHNGPAIIIAYSPCVEHGIKGGMPNTLNESKLAVNCGYVLLMRYINNELYLDFDKPDFDKYEEYLNNEVRFNSLKIKDSKLASKLLSLQKENAIKRFNYYQSIKNNK